MKYSFIILTLMYVWRGDLSIMYIERLGVGFMYYFEDVTTWYQSVPGLNTLGTCEVVSTTVGLSRLLETYV